MTTFTVTHDHIHSHTYDHVHGHTHDHIHGGTHDTCVTGTDPLSPALSLTFSLYSTQTLHHVAMSRFVIGGYKSLTQPVLYIKLNV